MKRFLLIIALLMLPATLLASERSSFDYFNPIPMSEVLRYLHRPGTVILDVNDQALWEKQHIPGAVHVVEGTELKLYLPEDKTSLLIFYCAGPLCRASADAANEAVLMGFRQVYVMTDGIFTWAKAGNPVESSKPAQGAHAEVHAEHQKHEAAEGHPDHQGHQGHGGHH